MGIAFGSINSGLPKDIVQQIVAGEKIPIQQMQERKSKIEAKKGLVSELTKLMENVRGEVFKNKGERSLREIKIDTNENLIGVTADKNIAMPGNYQVEVTQLARKSSAISNGIEDKENTYLGVGYIQYKLPDGSTKEVYIDEEHSSLDGIAKLINKDSESGMHATVVNDGTDKEKPWRLIIALTSTGDGKKAEFPNLYFVDGEEDLYFESHRDAQDAKIKLDGFEIQVPENKANEIIPGLTIDLKKAKPGDEFTLSVKEDSQAITGKISSLVDNINKVFEFIKSQNTMDETTDTSKTLGGDITLQTLESRLRSTIFTPIRTKTGVFRISDIGISFQRNGVLKFDAAKFEKEIESNYQKVSEIVAGSYSIEGGKNNGFVDNLDSVVNQLLQQPNGVLNSRKNGLQRNIDDIDKQIDNKERMIARKEENLKAKFARLEETINRIKSQGAGLAGIGSAPSPLG
ncbi:MAG: flagellar filament capping protein FliD [Bacteriovoracaceae bacterium]|nr:flagellar filament capping protein FliD [Bacteriovoracaceae bacterium]